MVKYKTAAGVHDLEQKTCDVIQEILDEGHEVIAVNTNQSHLLNFIYYKEVKKQLKVVCSSCEQPWSECICPERG